MRTDIDTPLLSLPAVARLLGVNYKTARKLVTNGEIPASRIGERLYRVDRADLDLYLARTREGEHDR